MSNKFRKNKEDFVCEKCGENVVGDGYTNHCTNCLWSKHVDINPGDREALCRGLMKPVNGEKDGDGFVLTNRCEKCGYEKRNRLSKNDNMDTFFAVVTEYVKSQERKI